MAVAGNAADVVRDAGAGLCCASQDSRALANAVRTLYTMPEAERERMGQAGRETFLNHYTRRVLTDRYEVLFGDIVHTWRRRHRNSIENKSRHGDS